MEMFTKGTHFNPVDLVCAVKDYQGKPFGPMPYLMAVAEEVRKVHAICVRCGNLANHSHRLSDSEELVVLGEKEAYEPLCRECYNKAIAAEKAKA